MCNMRLTASGLHVQHAADCWMHPTTHDGCAPSFVELVRNNSLAIAQPAIEHGPVSWPITRRIPGSVVHRRACDLLGLRG